MLKKGFPIWRVVGIGVTVLLAILVTGGHWTRSLAVLGTAMAGLNDKTTDQAAVMSQYDARIRTNEQFRAVAEKQLENIDKHLVMQSEQLRWIQNKLETTPRWP